MSGIIEHYWNLCGGDIKTKSWNMQDTSTTEWTASAGDPMNLVAGATGQRIVLFSIYIQPRNLAAQGSVKSGLLLRWGASGDSDKLVGYYLVQTASLVGYLYPLQIVPPTPFVGSQSLALTGVHYNPDASTLDTGLVIQYGLIPATRT